MTFDEILLQILELRRRDGRVSYRALKRRFELDEEYLEDLKAEIIQAKKLAIDEAGAVLVWTAGSAPAAAPAGAQERAPLAYTPAYLAEKILASRAALEGERKQVTVLFADLKGSTELIAGLDPEEARQLLDPALHVMIEAVQRYEGTVNQVLGDGIAAFLYETRLFPEREFMFKHALTHEVAYGSLLQERRRVLHAHIVEALEALGPDRVAEQGERLAHHALRGEVREKAVTYCRQAGAKALARSAYREAAGYFEQALAVLQHLPESHATHGKPSICTATCAWPTCRC